METKTAVRVYTLDFTCDLCGKAPLRPNNHLVPGYPPMYSHSCAKCGNTKNFPEKYPRQLFEEIPFIVEEAHHPAPAGIGYCDPPAPAPVAISYVETRAVETPRGKTLVEVFSAEALTPQQEIDAALEAVAPKTVTKRKPSKRKK